MDSSRLYGLPVISTAQAPAKALSFTGIKAPLTIDDSDDFEYSSSPSNAENSYTSEDDFDTDSERPSVDDPEPDPNEQTIEKTIFVNRPSVEYSDGESVEERSNLDEFDDTISSVTGPDVENLEISDSRQGIPIALLSVDNDDDDSEGSVVMEDDGFSGAVRIPSYGVLERIGSAPKVRVFEEEEEDNESEYENAIEEDDAVVAEGGEKDELEYENVLEKQVVVVDSELVDGNVDRLASDNDKQDIAECTVSDLVPAEILEYKDCDVKELKEEIKVECDVASKDYLPLKELESSGMELEEDIKIVNLDIDSKPSVLLKWVVEEPKELNFSGTDDMAIEASNLQVGETACLTQIGNKEIQDNNIEQEIDENVESDQLFPLSFSEVDGLPEGDELSGDSNISRSMAVNEDDNCAFESVQDEENSFSFNNDEGLTFTSSDGAKEIIDQSDYKSSGSLLDGTKSSLDHLHNIEGGIVTGSDAEVDTIEENKEKAFDTASDHAVEHIAQGILSEAEKSKLEKICLNFSCLIHRLNQPPEDSIAAQVFNQLALATGKPLAQAFSIEADSRNDLNFSLNVLVIGKTGVGKSATINSMFGEYKAVTDAFKPGTTSVKEMVGLLAGVKVRVLDTPGLRSSITEQMHNCKVLMSIKKAMSRCPPDVVLYVDRLDIESRDLCDLLLLKSITTYLGPSIWDKTIVTLTHAASSPPDGPNGIPLSYESFVAQRLHSIQQLINNSVVDLHVTSAGLMSHRISLVENHSETKEILLPDGENWRSQLLLLCYSIKILSELSSVVKTRDANLEMQSKEKDYPNLDLSPMKWKGDLVWGCNLQSHLCVGRSFKVGVMAELDKKISGQISIRTSNSGYTQIAMLGVVTLVKDIMRRIYPQDL